MPMSSSASAELRAYVRAFCCACRKRRSTWLTAVTPAVQAAPSATPHNGHTRHVRKTQADRCKRGSCASDTHTGTCDPHTTNLHHVHTTYNGRYRRWGCASDIPAKSHIHEQGHGQPRLLMHGSMMCSGMCMRTVHAPGMPNAGLGGVVALASSQQGGCRKGPRARRPTRTWQPTR